MKRLLLLSFLVVSLFTVSQAQMVMLRIWTDRSSYSRYDDVKIHVDAFNQDGTRADCQANMHISSGKSFDVTWGFALWARDYPAVQPVVDFWQSKSKGLYTVTVTTVPGSIGGSPTKSFTDTTTFVVQ